MADAGPSRPELNSSRLTPVCSRVYDWSSALRHAKLAVQAHTLLHAIWWSSGGAFPINFLWKKTRRATRTTVLPCPAFWTPVSSPLVLVPQTPGQPRGAYLAPCLPCRCRGPAAGPQAEQNTLAAGCTPLKVTHKAGCHEMFRYACGGWCGHNNWDITQNAKRQVAIQFVAELRRCRTAQWQLPYTSPSTNF